MKTALWLYALENDLISLEDVICGSIAVVVALAFIFLFVYWFSR